MSELKDVVKGLIEEHGLPDVLRSVQSVCQQKYDELLAASVADGMARHDRGEPMPSYGEGLRKARERTAWLAVAHSSDADHFERQMKFAAESDEDRRAREKAERLEELQRLIAEVQAR